MAITPTHKTHLLQIFAFPYSDNYLLSLNYMPIMTLSHQSVKTAISRTLQMFLLLWNGWSTFVYNLDSQ